MFTYYPPIIDDYMPAFIYNSGCKIYFSLSQFNNIPDISSATIDYRVTKQNSNLSLLQESDIGNKKYAFDSEKNMYYITINSNEIKGGFSFLYYYKIQIRFKLNNNSVSEWSKLCVLKPISEPVLVLDTYSQNMTYFSLVHGNVTFNSGDSESLDMYRCVISGDDGVIVDSGNVKSENNIINYLVPYLLDNGAYQMSITLITSNGYVKKRNFNFNINMTAPSTNIDISYEPINYAGLVKVKLSSATNFITNFALRRSASTDNFKTWEDIYIGKIDLKPDEPFYFDDKTTESGIFYKYLIQIIDDKERRSQPIFSTNEEPVYCGFDDMFFVAENKILRFRLNNKVSSFKYVVTDNKTTTLGSKYPYIKRTSPLYYREFSLSGTIARFNEFEARPNVVECSLNEFTPMETDFYLSEGTNNSVYGNAENLYTNTNENVDNVSERLFREKIMHFLYNDNVKLFKSINEGNILVRLTDISLSPREDTAGKIYDFSCTASEIAEPSVSNYNYYNVQSTGGFLFKTLEEKEQEQYFKQELKLLRYMGPVNANREIISGYLSKTYTEDLQVSNTKYSVDGIVKFIRINFISEPTPLDKNMLGYTIIINGEPVYIGKNGVLELHGDDVLISSLVCPYDSEIILDYILQVTSNNEEDMLSSIKKYSETKSISQIRGNYSSGMDLLSLIKFKHLFIGDNIKEYIKHVDSVTIEAQPGTIINTSSDGTEAAYNHVINDNRILHFKTYENGFYSIDGLYVDGSAFITYCYTLAHEEV